MSLTDSNLDLAKFETEWTNLGRVICQTVYINPESQKLKAALVKNGFLSLEEKSRFIDICDKIKYDVIYAKYGKADSEGYRAFGQAWQRWFQGKGVESQKDRSQRSSVDHILFGSTPDPEQFLVHFEEEMLGSMKNTAE